MARLVARVNMSPHLFRMMDEENKRLMSLRLIMGPWQSKAGSGSLLRGGVVEWEGRWAHMSRGVELGSKTQPDGMSAKRGPVGV